MATHGSHEPGTVRRARRRGLVASLATAAAVSAATAAPAIAATRSVEDPKKDSTAPNDVVLVTVKNGGPVIRTAVNYRNLKSGHLGADLVIDPGAAGGPTWHLRRFEDFDGSWVVDLWRVRGNWRDYKTVKCPGKKVTADATTDVIKFALPRTCLGKAKSANKARFQIVGGQQEGADVPREYAPNRPVLVRRG